MTKDRRQDGRATLAEIFAATRNGDLSDSEVRLWLVVRYLDRGKGCYAATETLATELHCSPSKVEKRRAGLVVRKWLELTFRGPKEPVLRAVTPAEALQDNEGLAPEETPEALHDNTELGPEALQDNEELEEGSSAPSSSPSFAQSCKQSTGSTGKETTTPPIPSPQEGSDAESGTDPPSPTPGEEVALRAEAEAGTDPPSSPPSENGRPPAGRFPSRELVELVRAEWWLGDRPPVDAPPGWTEGAECRFLERRIWPHRGDEETRLFVRGVRHLAEAEDTNLCVRDGDSQEARPLLPAEGFTGALVRAWLRQNPGLPHEAIGAARKADELNHARDGPASGQHDSGPLRALATEVVNATERGA